MKKMEMHEKQEEWKNKHKFIRSKILFENIDRIKYTDRH
jgi:hypothetical protein